MKKPEVINGSSIYANDQFSIKKFWLRAFCIFAFAEAVYWAIHYFTLLHNCSHCLRPVAFYVSQWGLNLLFTGALWYGLYLFSNGSFRVVVLVNFVAFALHYFLWLFIYYNLIKSGPGWLTGYRHSGYFTEFVYDSWFDIGKYV